MTVEYLGLADYLEIAAEVTGSDLETLLADSALHAPAGAGKTLRAR